MAKTGDIIKSIEDFAPLDTAQEWDNSGWQINLKNTLTKRVMLALTLTPDVLNQAIISHCDLIITHHPIIFNPLKKIVDPLLTKTIKNNIQVYSAHTNLDIAKGGITDYLATKLGFRATKTNNDFIKKFDLPKEEKLETIIKLIKSNLNLEHIKLINPSKKQTIKSIALCSGAGGSFISDLNDSKIDLYITGDIKYHEALNADNLVIIDIGHFESERIVIDIFKKILKNVDIEIFEANEKNIWQIL
ncbi:MAG: Nif3-like dinuclear metal center hexameric protein [Candidatus Gastranaerophilales bacterium]|nr:Nif3-like dinuclear metal center hexameric protein [Candidatus Gastranaerophilales bacterium]